MSSSPRAVASVTAIGALTAVVLGTGIATASNGGSLVLGHKNVATKTTSLTNRHGTPLSLTSGHGKPPLKVNSSKQVKKLNASKIGGKTASDLATLGSGDSLKVDPSSPNGADVTLPNATDPNHLSGKRIVATGVLPTGVYAVSATALLGTDSSQAGCYVAVDSGPVLSIGTGSEAGSTTIAMSLPVTLSKPGRIGEFCFGFDADGIKAYDAGMTAVRLSQHPAGEAATASAARRSARR